MANKSINPTDGLETACFGIKHSGLGFSFFGFNPYSDTYPVLNANNGYDSSVNPQGSLKKGYE